MYIFKSVEEMNIYIENYARENNLQDTLNSLYFAREKHLQQQRNGGQPYILHPLSMACMSIALGIKDDFILSAILLHDVVEDCNVSLSELPVSDDKIKEIVNLLTFKFDKDRNKNKDLYLEQKNIYFENIKTSVSAMYIKILDRSNNVSTMSGSFKKDRMLRYIKETKEKVLPLCDLCVQKNPQYYSAIFILNFHINSVISSIENVLEKNS